MIDVVFMTSNIKYPLIKSKTLCFCVISKLSEARRVSSEAPERAVSARIAVTECPQMALRTQGVTYHPCHDHCDEGRGIQSVMFYCYD